MTVSSVFVEVQFFEVESEREYIHCMSQSSKKNLSEALGAYMCK